MQCVDHWLAISAYIFLLFLSQNEYRETECRILPIPTSQTSLILMNGWVPGGRRGQCVYVSHGVLESCCAVAVANWQCLCGSQVLLIDPMINDYFYRVTLSPQPLWRSDHVFICPPHWYNYWIEMASHLVTVSALLSLVGPAHQLFLSLAVFVCDVFWANKIWFDWFEPAANQIMLHSSPHTSFFSPNRYLVKVGVLRKALGALKGREFGIVAVSKKMQLYDWKHKE